mgnify:FL=1
MPYKSGKLKGQLTAPEIRKLIKAHNILMSIKIPPGTDREGLIKLVEANKYKVNHEKSALVPASAMKRKPEIPLSQANALTKPVPKSALQKQKAQEVKETKAIQKKKEVREIKKQAVQQQKQIKAKQQPPKPKPVVKKEAPKPVVKKIVKTNNQDATPFIGKKEAPKSLPKPKPVPAKKLTTSQQLKKMKDNKPAPAPAPAPVTIWRPGLKKEQVTQIKNDTGKEIGEQFKIIGQNYRGLLLNKDLIDTAMEDGKPKLKKIKGGRIPKWWKTYIEGTSKLWTIYKDIMSKRRLGKVFDKDNISNILKFFIPQLIGEGKLIKRHMSGGQEISKEDLLKDFYMKSSDFNVSKTGEATGGKTDAPDSVMKQIEELKKHRLLIRDIKTIPEYNTWLKKHNSLLTNIKKESYDSSNKRTINAILNDNTFNTEKRNIVKNLAMNEEKSKNK